MAEPRALALAYLATHNVITLATSGADGVWAAAVFYASAGFDLVFLSAATTRHARHLAENPWAAGAIQQDYRAWPDIRGIQLEGSVQRLTGLACAAAIALYMGKYPFVAQPEGPLAPALARVSWYRVQPHRLYFIDNSQGLGHRTVLIEAGRSAGV